MSTAMNRERIRPSYPHDILYALLSPEAGSFGSDVRGIEPRAPVR